jgi:hypothetical protein
MAAAARQEVTHVSAPRKNPSGKVLPFTRHKKELAGSALLELRAATRFVLHVLLMAADGAGVCWVSARSIADMMPRSAKVTRYSLVTILRALRELRDLGLLSWERVAPFGRFPSRGNKRGKWTQSGGRTWQLDLEKLRALPQLGLRLPDVGTELGGSITYDRSGSITHDRPSDLSSPPEKLNRDPAAGPTGTSGSPSGAHEVRSRGKPGSAEATGAPTASLPRPTERVASETPRAAPTARASQHHPSPPPASRDHERQGGKEEQPACRRSSLAVSRDHELEFRRDPEASHRAATAALEQLSLILKCPAIAPDRPKR